MKIELKKFGTTLTSRQSGKEAFAAFQPTLQGIGSQEEVVVDFAGVNTFSPSWADEIISPLREQFGERLFLLRSDNPSVRYTLEMLEQIHDQKFQMR